jgi:hypothetical protein
VPRRVARQRNYDVSFVGNGIKSVTPEVRDRDAISRILGRPPSHEFMDAYNTIVTAYIAHRAAVSRSTPAAVQRRMEAVENGAKILQESLNNLELTDKMLFGQSATKRFLSGQRYTELDVLSEAISYFLPVIEEAVSNVKKEPKRGRMPAYAERGLAHSLGQILCEETNVAPTTTRGGMFDRLVRLALTHAPNAKLRKDVVDLLRVSLRAIPEDPSLLSAFRKADGTRRPASGHNEGKK